MHDQKTSIQVENPCSARPDRGLERMTGIEPAFSAWELLFAPETRMNAGIGVPTMSAATALRQHNKVRAALAGFSRTPLFRNELLAQIGDVDTDRAMGTTSASPGASHDTPSHDLTGDVHDAWACTGCDRILGVCELEVVLDLPRNTLYKRSRLGDALSRTGYPLFPRRLQDRSTIAVRCRDAKAYLEEVTA